MSIRVAINGFGRIGRNVARVVKQCETHDLEIVAVNDLTEKDMLAHLFKYDSVHGTYGGEVVTDDGGLVIDGESVKVFSERDPARLPWKQLGVDLVVESTGFFREREQAAKHLEAGAKKVIISAPGKNEDKTIVLGVNEGEYDSQRHDVISNASCTTNCLAPVIKVLNDSFGFVHGLMTTVHAYTNDQVLLDIPKKDKRRARAAALSMIPTTTGAAKATALVIPEVEGKIDGMAIRVPTADVSVIDLVAQVESEITADMVNDALREASLTTLNGILDVCDKPLVSVDFLGNTHSSVVDALSTSVMNDHMVKILSWYDNEWGYSCRVVDLAAYIGQRL
ncbi:MAG: type I glyceraldehyde-3-phosphate dehydrogenase [Longimicrobiales bacterium]|jgi:glyceraldehyde 3-phosphate dehydrogenase|nr:type I glyceraldehyde-3-phosphate dehydrogenase [Longimicrobiales bacterium]|tara:strand:+ start:589 stop:1599 length:1011 start_codon:yes stop_codon:yes gene_type:complete